MRYFFLSLSIFVALLTIIISFQNLTTFNTGYINILFNPRPVNIATGWIVFFGFMTGILTSAFFVLFHFGKFIFSAKQYTWEKGDAKKDILKEGHTSLLEDTNSQKTPQNKPEDWEQKDW